MAYIVLWLLLLTAGVTYLILQRRRDMESLDQAIENLREALVTKLDEAVEIIKDPDQDNAAAVAKLEELTQFVRDFDLTPDGDGENEEGELPA
jgi:hypothetical protein